MKSILKFISPKSILETEIEEWQSLLSVFLCIGISLYFWTDLSGHEVVIGIIIIYGLIGSILFIPKLISRFLSSNYEYGQRPRSSFYGEYISITVYGILMLTIILGYFRTIQRAESINTKIISKTTGVTKVVGEIIKLDIKEDRIKIHLQNPQIQKIEPEKTPKIISITIKKNEENEFEIGDKIVLRAILMPPAMPMTPLGFDFRRFAYFQGIGAIGYGIGKVTVLRKEIPLPKMEISKIQKINATFYKIKTTFYKIRKLIGKKIKEAVNSDERTIITGLLLGEMSEIKKSDYEAMKIAGTAHIIAISGMHLAVASLVIFYIIKKIMIFFYFLDKNLPREKTAALITIIITLLYLLTVGSPVSAQRAFIVSSLTLVAIIIDRNANQIRNMSFAAIGILIFEPEMLFNPSFQMSFGACISILRLLPFLEHINDRIESKMSNMKIHYLISKLVQYIVSLFLISLFATIGSSPFIIHHFNQFSVYSVLSNMLCVPISDFVAMPLGIIGMILMPLGLEKIALVPMAYSIGLILKISHYISSLPMASLHIQTFSNFAIFLFSVSFLCLMLAKSKIIQYVALMLLFFSISTLFIKNKVDIIISGNAKIFAVGNHLIEDIDYGESKIIPSSLIKEKFTREVWKQTFGKDFDNDSKLNYDNCSEEKCFIKYSDKIVIIRGHKKGKKGVIKQDYDLYCENADFIDKISFFVNMRDNDKCKNAKQNITVEDIRKNGTHFIHISNGEIVIDRVSNHIMLKKPWYS